MFLFEYKDSVKISHTCKLCMQEISFEITKKEYEQIEEFPIGKEFIHGDPPHKLILYLNKNLEVENFKIEQVINREGAFYSQELTKKVLGEIGLTDEEIELYFLTTGRGVISLAEISILIGKDKDECKEIADKFVAKGLYKEILGATPHYFTLPPYAALLRQLEDFRSYIDSLKKDTKDNLLQSFSRLESEAESAKKLKEFIDYVANLKQSMLKQMYSQKKDFDTALSEVDNIKKITEESIPKLEENVRKAIDNQLLLIDKKKLREELERFFRRFKLNLKEAIENTIEEINDITKTTENARENVKNIFADVSKNFSNVLMDAEAKLEDISEGISNSLNNMRNVFSNEVLNALESTLEKIMEKLKLSEITTKEFWEKAKEVSLFTMRDVWFVKSIEGIKSQIRDEIPRAKMRLLIVTPEITDINPKDLEKCQSRVNIRIATNVDIHNNDHIEVFKQISKMKNAEIRISERKDIWGINKDSEVVIICALSHDQDGNIKEIAGIGTSTQEHIKIFVPIIEDVWMSAKKQKAMLYRHSLGIM
ncbi:MAG: hypothetical protein ACTSQP_07010 [Promethearchaeota archaeon]